MPTEGNPHWRSLFSGRAAWNLGWAASGLLLGFLAGDWLASFGVLVLWGIWRYFSTWPGPPVLPVVLSLQWAQVASGLYFLALTGTPLAVMKECDYRSVTLLGLVYLVALAVGLLCGRRAGSRLRARRARPERLRWKYLVAVYGASFVGKDLLGRLAWSIPGLTQPLLALQTFHLVFLYMVFRRLLFGRRWGWVGVVAALEIASGFTGFFSEYRAPLQVLLVVALEGIAARPSLRRYAAFGCGAATLVFASVLWTGIKDPYRARFRSDEPRTARLARGADLALDWLAHTDQRFVPTFERLVNRVWDVRYHALAFERVPKVVPHENGRLLWDGVRHVLMPRLLFPEKEPLPSDSLKVRKYSGVWVAGPESGTSVGFSYVLESYVDFGLPWMYLPLFAYGILGGAAFAFLARRLRGFELRQAVLCALFMTTLDRYEIPWSKVLGGALTRWVVVGGAALVLEGLLLAYPFLWWRPRRREGSSQRRSHAVDTA